MLKCLKYPYEVLKYEVYEGPRKYRTKMDQEARSKMEN